SLDTTVRYPTCVVLVGSTRFQGFIGLDSELSFDKFGGEGWVGFALGKFHDLTDQETDGFHLTVFYIGGGFFVFGQDLVDYFYDFGFVTYLEQVLVGGDGVGVFAGLE